MKKKSPDPANVRVLANVTLAIGFLLLACQSGSAAGPAWLAELSNQDATDPQPVKTDSIEIWMPAGTYATAGVYETESTDVQAPDAVRTDVYRIRYVKRTVFKLGYGFSKKLKDYGDGKLPGTLRITRPSRSA